MPKKSIYQSQCPQMAQLFDAVDSPSKVLIVALDFSKDSHQAMFCNGVGTQLLKPFPVKNNRDGLDYLLERIRTTCKRHAIGGSSVIIGGEDLPPFAENFLYALHQQKSSPLVVRVNAFKAKKQRENLQASTDSLDLTGIAKTLLNREAYLAFDESGPHGNEYAAHDASRIYSRNRDFLIKMRTAISNRIHNEVKVLFPTFLDITRSNPISPFTQTSLILMAKADFHASSYARKRPDALTKLLTKFRLQEPRQKAETLIERARHALPPRPASIPAHQKCLTKLIEAYKELDALAGELEKAAAMSLAQTPAAVLTSISGVGIVTAAALAGEQGHVDHLGPLRHLCSYAGIVPGHEQTGGPEKPGVDTKVKRRCNRRLKKHLVHVTFQMGTRNGPPDFRESYDELLSRGQHADFVMARRLLGMTKAMMRHRFIYLPPDLRENLSSQRERFLEHLSEAWPKLIAKWKAHGALEEAFAKENPLGVWRESVEQLQDLVLPMDGSPPYQKAPKTI